MTKWTALPWATHKPQHHIQFHTQISTWHCQWRPWLGLITVILRLINIIKQNLTDFPSTSDETWEWFKWSHFLQHFYQYKWKHFCISKWWSEYNHCINFLSISITEKKKKTIFSLKTKVFAVCRKPTWPPNQQFACLAANAQRGLQLCFLVCLCFCDQSSIKVIYLLSGLAQTCRFSVQHIQWWVLTIAFAEGRIAFVCRCCHAVEAPCCCQDASAWTEAGEGLQMMPRNGENLCSALGKL